MNSPVAVLLAVCAWFVSSLVALISAPVTTAPETSMIAPLILPARVPEIAPVGACAATAGTHEKASRSAKRMRVAFRMALNFMDLCALYGALWESRRMNRLARTLCDATGLHKDSGSAERNAQGTPFP